MIDRLKIVRNLVIVFIAAVIIGSLLNIIAAVLPTGRIHYNVINSAEIFFQEGMDPKSLTGIDASLGDNNTDAWMLLIADYNGQGIVHERIYDGVSALDKSYSGIKSVFSRAFDGSAYFYNGPESSGLVGFDNIFHTVEPDPDTVWLYPRYWHGWMLGLKLLLMIFSYSDIRILLMIIHIFLLFAIILAFKKRGKILPGIAFVAAIISMVPTTYMISIDFSMSTLIMETAVLILLTCNKYLDSKKGGYLVFFMIVGIATSYLDFLTFPTITLTFPLVIWVLNMIDSPLQKNIKASIIQFILCGLLWVVGYFGMWAAKWVVVTIFTDPDMINNVLSQISLRTSDVANQVSITVGDVLAKNFSKFNYIPIQILGAVVLLISILVGKFKKPSLNQVIYLVELIVIASVPLIWLSVLANHSYIHDHFTYRNLSGMFFALAVAIMVIKGNSTFKRKDTINGTTDNLISK